MGEIKERWQFIIGIAAIIISLSAFNDELKKIVVDFQFVSFSLSEYLFTLIMSCIFVVNLYVIPYIFSSTRYSNLKILRYIESLSYILFLIIIVSPSLLLVIFSLKLLLVLLTTLEDSTESILMAGVTLLTTVITFILSMSSVRQRRTIEKFKEESELIEKKIKSTETANKLIKDGFYNQSLLESFKMLELGLYKILSERDLVFRRGSFLEMVRIAKKNNVFSDNQIEQINLIRMKRNKFIHEIGYTLSKSEVERDQQLIKEILSSVERVSPSTSESDNKYFRGKVINDIKKAKGVAKKQNKPIFVVIYDKLHPKLSKLDYSLNYFMEYETTKKLVHDNFIQVLTDSESPLAKELIPVDDPLENCLLTVLSPADQIIYQEGVYANPDEGFKRTKEIIAKWNKMTCS